VPAGGSLLTALTGSVAAKVAAVAVAGAAVVGIGYQTLPTRPGHAAPAKRPAAVRSRESRHVRESARRRSHRVAVASAVRRHESRQATAHASRAAHRAAAANSSASHATTSTVAPSVSTVSNGGRIPDASKSHGKGRTGNGSSHASGGKSHVSTRNSHAAPTTPASHGNHKPLKGSGHAFGRSTPQKTKPAPATKTAPGPVATPPGQAKPKQNSGKGHAAG
jgi:hypothetical protein